MPERSNLHDVATSAIHPCRFKGEVATGEVFKYQIGIVTCAGCDLWAVWRDQNHRTQETHGTHLVVAVLGGLVLLFGIILAFRGGKEAAEVTISLPGGFNMTLSRVG